MLSVQDRYVRFDMPYAPELLPTVRSLSWAHGGGFRSDATGRYWLFGLSGVRQVIAAIPHATISRDVQQLAREQAWMA
ncbi:MAG: hypothetical protein HC828_01480 [Blastochloris sp.]|nr:hypothetical protein [Blastochloris sp.]